MRLIVNADDYGFDENASRAIATCFERGLVTQTTLMVNMPWCDRAVALARERGFADRIGLHVNLSEGVPLTETIRRFPNFCGPDGAFNNRIREVGRLRFWLSRAEKRAVREEIDAQMEKFLSLGLQFRHYDSHGHVGAFLSILPTALACGRRHGFTTTRRWINLSGSHRDVGMSVVKRLYAALVGLLVRLAGYRTTRFLGWAWDLKRLPMTMMEKDVVEVLCHPMYAAPDPEMAKKEIVQKRMDDAILIDTLYPIEETLVSLADRKCERITYGELP